MKLVDLLIKHNVQWPNRSTHVWQGRATGLLYFQGIIPGDRDFNEISEDAGLPATTKEQYDAALAKHKAKWIRNRGVKQCPVLPNRAYQVRFRDGFIAQSLAEENDAMNCIWSHTGEHWDIMAWRYV